MNKEKVSKCSICLQQRNRLVHNPKSPECNDLVCLKCNQGINKSSKNLRIKNIKYSLNDRPISNQNHSDIFYCKAHPSSSIEFYCEIDNCAMCYQCKSNHEIFNHQVNKFTPKKSTLENELERIIKSIEDENVNTEHEASSLSKLKDSFYNYLNEQLNQLNTSTEQFIQSILKQKMMIQKDLKAQYTHQLKEIELLITNTGRINEEFTKLMEQCREYKGKLNEEKIVFDKVDNMKKSIIINWEHLRLDILNNKILLADVYQSKRRYVTVVPEQLGQIFKLTDKNIISMNNNDNNIVHTELYKKEIHRSNNKHRSESLGSAQVSSKSTKGESNRKPINYVLFKPKRFSDPNIQPHYVFHINQSHSQRLII